MEERTLLAEIETEKQKIVEKKFKEYKSENIQQKIDTNKKINIFSSSAFANADTSVSQKIQEEAKKLKQNSSESQIKPEEEIIEDEESFEEDFSQEKSAPSASENSFVIEKPNYDFMQTLTDKQREKVFSEEKPLEKASPSSKRSKFKVILMAVLFAIFGVWGIVNISTLDSVNNQISQVSYQYDMNLIKYLNNLYNLDATSSQNMQNLLETIPEDEVPPTTVKEKSNWFDKFCNFIAGFFGG